MSLKLRTLPFCFASFLVLSFLLSACASDTKEKTENEATTTTTYANGEIVIYTCMYGPAEKAVFEAYSQSHQVKVNVVYKPTKALIAQVQGEGEGCPADIILLDDIAYLFQLKNAELSRVLISTTLSERIPAGLYDPEGYWFAISQRAMGVAYAKDRVAIDELTNYQDLANFWGKIAMPDPSSTSFRSFIGSIIARTGFNKAKEWGDALVPKFVKSDTFMQSLTKGEADLALMYSSEYLSAIKGQAELAESIGFKLLENDKGFQSINVNGLIFARYSKKNVSNALRFIEYITDQPAQEILAAGKGVYPIHEQVEAADELKALGIFKPDPLDLESLGLQQSQAVKLMKEWQ